MQGRFITFEGGEGTGKSTQVRLLAERLKRAGVGVVVTREPGGSVGAEIIRHVLLSGAAKALGADAEAILFAAARSDHVATLIAPALQRGTWVLCDRFADSTRVYQGVLGDVDGKIIRALERVAVGNTKPDLTLVLDMPAEEGLARASKRRGKAEIDRFEGESVSFHERLREAYRALAATDKQRCMLVDARGEVDGISAVVWALVAERFGLAARGSEAAS